MLEIDKKAQTILFDTNLGKVFHLFLVSVQHYQMKREKKGE